MPCMVVLRRLAGVALVLVVVLALSVAAQASDPPPAQVKGADRPHPDAAKINQSNSRVIHAGPGAPIAGAIFTPPGPGKKDKKE